MKFKDDFKTQASIAWALKHAMVLYPGYQKLLEERLPEMSDKGQAESLRIKLRILLDMLGESTPAPARSAEEILESEIIVNHKIAGEDIPLIQLSGAKRAMHTYASQFRPVVTDEEIKIEGRNKLIIMDNGGGYTHYPSFFAGAKWMREKMKGK